MPLPLEGIRILDLTRALAGPFCTMILGDLGATVIKTEPAQGGDMSRSWGPYHDGIGVFYLSINRNKQSLAVNFREPRGLELLQQLAKQHHLSARAYFRIIKLARTVAGRPK